TNTEISQKPPVGRRGSQRAQTVLPVGFVGTYLTVPPMSSLKLWKGLGKLLNTPSAYEGLSGVTTISVPKRPLNGPGGDGSTTGGTGDPATVILMAGNCFGPAAPKVYQLTPFAL